MQIFLLYLFILLCDVRCHTEFLGHGSYEEPKELGDVCHDEEGKFGNCTKIEHCHHARKMVKAGGQPKGNQDTRNFMESQLISQICGFVGLNVDPIVCCSIESQKNARFDKMIHYSSKGSSYNACLEYNEMVCPRNPAVLERRKPIIADGKDAYLEQFPYMVLLGSGEDLETARWDCGGSIISQRFVLTAAHCTSYGERVVKFILVGTLRRSIKKRQGRLYRVLKIYKHPGFNPPQHYNDIALLYTDRKIVFYRLAQPACLYYEYDEEEYLEATIAGWGKTGHRDEPSDALQYAMVSKYTDKECHDKYSTKPTTRRLKYGFDTTTMMCFGHHGGYTDACPGDSGGPLEVDNYLFSCLHTVIGVTSFGEKCGLKGQPGVYTKISAFLPWIEKIVWPFLT